MNRVDKTRNIASVPVASSAQIPAGNPNVLGFDETAGIRRAMEAVYFDWPVAPLNTRIGFCGE